MSVLGVVVAQKVQAESEHDQENQELDKAQRSPQGKRSRIASAADTANSANETTTSSQSLMNPTAMRTALTRPRLSSTAPEGLHTARDQNQGDSSHDRGHPEGLKDRNASKLELLDGTPGRCECHQDDDEHSDQANPSGRPSRRRIEPAEFDRTSLRRDDRGGRSVRAWPERDSTPTPATAACAIDAATCAADFAARHSTARRRRGACLPATTTRVRS